MKTSRCAAVAVIAAVFSASAQIPAFINYQGRLINGTNLVNGTVTFLFTLYDDAAGGTAQFVEQDSNVAVVDGLYSTTIGDNPLSGTLAAALTNRALWIEVTANGTTLSPRERVASVGYAMLAGGVTNGAILTPMIAASAVTGDKIADGAVSNEDLANGSVTLTKIATNTIVPLNVNSATFSNTFWMTTGNAGTLVTPFGNSFIGTVDNNGFDIRVNNSRAMRYRPDASSPLIIGGYASNTVLSSGSVIAGGGSDAAPQSIDGAFGFIGGGGGNRISNVIASVVAGGDHNVAGADYTAIGGGAMNQVLGQYGTVGGGQSNRATGIGATVPGGLNNAAIGTGSLAGGRRAHATHAGSFVWADNQDEDFGSRTTNQFLIRANRGFGLNVTNLAADIVLAGNPYLTTLVVAPGTNQPNIGSSQLMLAEDSAGSYGMLIQYDMSNEQLRVYEKDWLATNGPRMVIGRRNPTRVGIGTTNLQDTLTVGGNLVPDTGNTYALGSSGLPWSELHLGSEVYYSSDLDFYNGGGPVMTVGTNRNVRMTNDLYVRGNLFVGPQHSWTGTNHNSKIAFGSADQVYVGEMRNSDWMELRADQFYFSTGDVGIHTTNISSGVSLGVSGDIETSGDYMFTSPRSGALNLSAPLFQFRWGSSVDEYPSYESSQYLYASASVASPPYLLYLIAPVVLPDDVTVTNLIVYYYDDTSTTNVTVSAVFRRREVDRTTASQLAGITDTSSGRSTNVQSFSESTVINGTIDNQNYMYSINVSWTPGELGDNLRFYGCRLEYEVPYLSP